MAYDNLDKLVEYGRQIQTVDDCDIFFGVTGRKGTGKTTFSIEYSRRYVRQYFNENYFSVKKYVCYNNKDIDEKMHTLPIYSPIAGDEAIRFAWSREWNKSDNKDLVKLSTQIRPKKHILFMNIPRIVWIDKAYREGMLSIWAWIHSTIENGEKKSYAIIFEPDENQGEPDSWHLKKLRQTEGRIRRIGRFTDVDQMYKFVKNHPCFVDIIPFPRLPKEIYDEYMELRTLKVMEKESQFVDQKELAKIICYNLKYNWQKIYQTIQEGRFDKPTYRMIAELLSFDPTRKKSLVQHTTVRNWVNEVMQKVDPTKVENADDTIEQSDEAGA